MQQQISPAAFVYDLQQPGDPQLSPDGATLAYTTTFDPENPSEEPPKEGEPAKVRVTRRLDYKMDGRGWLGDVRTATIAPSATYAGTRSDASWLPDEASARAWQTIVRAGAAARAPSARR